MLRLFEFLMSGCWHKWEDVDRQRLEDGFGQQGTRVYVRCTKCGTHKKIDLI